LILTFVDHCTVELLDDMATDQKVVQAARVSTQGSEAEATESAGLINYLMRDRHGSPFEHAVFTWRVTAPIFVWREHMRHRMASYNEESGRYKQLEPVFYMPADDRPLTQVGKPGAYRFTAGTQRQTALVSNSLGMMSHLTYDAYLDMLDAGVAREVARMVLPVNIMSSATVTMNARALMNFLSLRRNVDGQQFPSFPQAEIEQVAEQYEFDFASRMPHTHEAFVRNGRVAP
jgi:thymidylate synthase (FAD)